MAQVRPGVGSGRRSTLATVVMTSLIRSRAPASRGLERHQNSQSFHYSDDLFLIVFNIFPLIYSLGYCVHRLSCFDERAGHLRRPAELPGNC